MNNIKLDGITYFKSIAIWIMVSFAFSFFFYRSVIAFVLILLLFPLFLMRQRKEYIRKKKWELCLEFKEYISMVAVNLSSGSSVENAFRKGLTDISRLYGENAQIVREVRIINTGLNNNIVLEKLLQNFGERSDIEEIKDFADIFSAGKRTGGNLREIIEDTATQIAEKIEMKSELKVVIAEKEFEQKIMCLVPFFILMYVGMTNKGYFDVLYYNPVGIMVMSIALAAYVGAYLWGETITKNII